MDLVLYVFLSSSVLEFYMLILFYSSLVIVFGCVVNVLWLTRANRNKVRDRAEMLAPYADEKEAQYDSGSQRAWITLGDQHPDFKYTL